MQTLYKRVAVNANNVYQDFSWLLEFSSSDERDQWAQLNDSTIHRCCSECKTMFTKTFRSKKMFTKTSHRQMKEASVVYLILWFTHGKKEKSRRLQVNNMSCSLAVRTCCFGFYYFNRTKDMPLVIQIKINHQRSANTVISSMVLMQNKTKMNVCVWKQSSEESTSSTSTLPNKCEVLLKAYTSIVSINSIYRIKKKVIP